MRITSKGQVTIPAEIRERAGLLPDTEVAFTYDGNVVQLHKAPGKDGTGRGARIVEHLKRVGRRAKHTKMSTDEIMELMRGR